MPAYKSYCWALGTTSFRTVEFNKKIELQLNLLNKFWNLPQFCGKDWNSNNDIQIAYYNYLKEQGFIEDKDAKRKDKDAREKTSGLVDLGLIDDNRRLTNVGQKLLSISQNGTFNTNNLLQLPEDSFIYFKQLLKLSYQFDNEEVRPFIVLACMLSELGEISKDEFTYLLPLAINREKTERIISEIKNIRQGNASIDSVITSILLDMPNYKLAQEMFLTANNVDEIIIKEIGMNRKSRDYDLPYFKLFHTLNLLRNEKENAVVKQVLEAVKKVSGKAMTYWKQYLFNTPLSSKIIKEGVSTLNECSLINSESEEQFRLEFFKLLHLFKAKSLLDDYYDLNKRYFKTSDAIIFQDGKIKLDIIPKCFFSICKDSLLDIAFTHSEKLPEDCELSEIDNCLNITQEEIFCKLREIYGIQAENVYEVQDYVEKERYERLNALIDTKFTDDNLIDLFSKFETRADSEIQSMITNNADVPTLFEYVLAIAWYKISGRKGKVLDYMNLSLDADLLPITHAAGGHEDITYKYEATNDYPKHTLLIEATLAGGTNQRRMEMEPVSRHLGDFILENPTEQAYCIFATTYLHINVIADFRGRRTTQYYATNSDDYVDGMKIIPCQTSEIKTIIENGITYAQLYTIFEQAYQSNISSRTWYENEIKNKL